MKMMVNFGWISINLEKITETSRFIALKVKTTISRPKDASANRT
jgi:hypothetical protein